MIMKEKEKGVSYEENTHKHYVVYMKSHTDSNLGISLKLIIGSRYFQYLIN